MAVLLVVPPPLTSCLFVVQSAPSEAQRLVFMSWPGERDLDKDLEFPNPSTVMDPRSLFPPQQAAAPPLAQPPKAVREDMRHRTTTRQLGYVIATSSLHYGLVSNTS